MKVWIVQRYTWYARDEWVIDSIWKSLEAAVKHSESIENNFRDIEEYEVQG